MAKIILGYAPTRRSIFSAPDARKFRGLISKKLEQLEVEFVDIEEFGEDGLLYDLKDVKPVAEKFRAAGIAGLFVPHCNFGCEAAVANLARELNVPVLLWGPRDERPDEEGGRLRDTQCGLFATGKVLRRHRVPFTYLKNCRLEDSAFEKGLANFLAVCNVVKAFRDIRILQISTRPYDFNTTMYNEGELLERFNIQIAPVPMTELTETIKAVKAERTELEETIAYIRDHMEILVEDSIVENVAALKVAMRRLADTYACRAVAIQCWNALQTEIGILPCTANALLTDEGLPVVCETDIHGAVSSILVQAAGMDSIPTFFADWTIRHPDNENGELLQHCGPWPLSLAKATPQLGHSVAFTHPGAVSAEARHGEVTLARFDGDNGEYSLLLGNAKGVDGPYTKGTYLWVEVENLDRLEDKVVTGPYIHHCTGIHGDVVPILYEACKYMGIQPDLYDPIEEKVRATIRGEGL